MSEVSTSGERVLSVVVLTEDPTGPSARHRFGKAAPRLQAHGIRVKFLPVEPPAVRPESFRAAADADLVILHRKLLRAPDLRRLRRATRGRMIFDLDDAVMYRPTGHKRQWSVLRALRFSRVLRFSHLFIAGNEYLASRGPRRVPVFLRPTPVELDDYEPRDAWPDRGTVIGWIGSDSTLKYLRDLAPTLRELCRQREDLVLRVIGPEPGEMPGVRVQHRPWSDEAEAGLIRDLDVGVLPLPDDLWTRGKCAFKALQYMAAGIPVVASPVGMNRDVVVEGETGYLADGPEAWAERLTLLLDDAGRRRVMGGAGRERIRERYSTEVLTAPLAAALRRTAR
jgi:glycosyltransferase involved in cell wall biosynthesis